MNRLLAPTVLDCFAQQHRQRPQAPACRFGDATLTYDALERRSNQVANALLARGIGPEDRVALCLQPSLELVVALWGVLKAGAAYLPLDPTHPSGRLLALAQQARPALALCLGETATPALGLPLLEVDGEAVRGASERAPGVTVHAEQLAYVLFTSGSTGRPKGVMVPHGALAAMVEWAARAFGFDANSRVLQKTPLSFDASVQELFLPLTQGGLLVLARPDGHREPAYLHELTDAEELTHLEFVPSLLRAFLEAPSARPHPTLRCVTVGGEPLPPELAERCHAQLQAPLYNVYGPTEATVGCTAAPVHPGEAISVGTAAAGTRVHVLGADLTPVAPGEPGELWISGAQLARGYFGAPELTAERFLPDPTGEPGARMYRSGDKARWRPDGALELLGRVDHQVKIRGVRVELGEVEAQLEAVPGVRAAAVVARADHAGNQRLLAFLEPAPGAADAQALAARAREQLEQALPASHVPSSFATLPALPRTPAGKVDRGALQGVDAPERDHRAPRPGVEQVVAEIWAFELQLPRVGLDDDVLSLGGESLAALRILARVEQELGARLSVRELFRARTLERFAALVAAARRAGAA